MQDVLCYHGDWNREAMGAICLRLHIPIPPGEQDWAVFQAMKQVGMQDSDRFLDIVEGVLQVAGDDETERLKGVLSLGGSSLTVSPAGDELSDVASPEVTAIVEAAIAEQDDPTRELEAAWSHAFGRSPDASDAWDHAIKAVESVLRPIVEPNNPTATLGSMIAVLNNAPTAWKAVFPGKKDDNDVSNLVATLRLIWPNTDRHGGGGRTPTLQEARAVVTLAATILQWHREGWVVSKR